VVLDVIGDCLPGAAECRGIAEREAHYAGVRVGGVSGQLYDLVGSDAVLLEPPVLRLPCACLREWAAESGQPRCRLRGEYLVDDWEDVVTDEVVEILAM
jgi:hypothetical protein